MAAMLQKPVELTLTLATFRLEYEDDYEYEF